MDTFSSIGNITRGNNVKIGRFCIVEDGVELGDDVVIDDYAMVLAGAKIGSGTYVGTYCKVGQNAIVGNNVRMTSYCEVRDDCVVGDRSTFGSRCTLSAGTIVEEDVIVKYGFVATDTPVLGVKEKKLCILKKGSKYGANVTIMPAVVVGENSEIGACSQVRKDVPDNQVWYGNPAKYFRDV